MRVPTLLVIPSLALVAVLASCRSDRAQAARVSEDVEGNALVVVHPDLDRDVRYVKHTAGRTDDGRMTIKVVLASHFPDADQVLIARTDWFDKEAMPLEKGTTRTIIVPPGGTYVYEDASYSTRAERFTVSLRPASTVRAN